MAALDGPSAAPLSEVRHQYVPFELHHPSTQDKAKFSIIADEPQLIEILEFFEQSSKRPVTDWLHGLDIWNGLVERARALWGNRWCFFPIANIASSVDIDTSELVGYGNLLDNNLPLCSRVAHVRMRNADHRWWLNQLEAAIDEIDVALVILMIVSWADGQVISDLISRLGVKLDSLSALSWRILYGMFQEMIWMINRRSEIPNLKIARDTLPIAMSPRLAATLLLMKDRIPDRTIFTRYLEGYEGEDKMILAAIQRHAITFALVSNMSWKKALKICRSTYRKGVAPDFPLLSRLSRKPKEMPLEFAKQVRDDVDKYPLSVLSIAEAALVTHVRKKIRPVYAIAREEKWFSN